MTDGCSCCAPRDLKRTLVMIGDATIGLAKLDRVFGEMYKSKKSPDDVDGEEIVNLGTCSISCGISRHNFTKSLS